MQQMAGRQDENQDRVFENDQKLSKGARNQSRRLDNGLVRTQRQFKVRTEGFTMEQDYWDSEVSEKVFGAQKAVNKAKNKQGLRWNKVKTQSEI